MSLQLPNQISNGAPNDGDEVQQNFNEIVDDVNQRIHSDGSVAMLAPLVLVDNTESDPTTAAATKAFVDERLGVATGLQVAKSGTIRVLTAGSVGTSFTFVTTGSPTFSAGTVVGTLRFPVDGSDGSSGWQSSDIAKFAIFDVSPLSFRVAVQAESDQLVDVFLDWVQIGTVA